MPWTFDGTLVDHCFSDIGAPVPGAFHWLKKWQEIGAKLILWTMRSDGRTGEGKENGPILAEAVEFCRQHGVEFYAVNENPTQKTWTQSPKVYAHLYVDDAAEGCPLRENPRVGGRPFVDWDIVGPRVYAKILAATKPATEPVEPCRHTDFVASVDLRLLKNLGRYLATLRLRCELCSTRFRFIALPYGYDLNGAAVSDDGMEARLALLPQGEELILVEDWRGGELVSPEEGT